MENIKPKRHILGVVFIYFVLFLVGVQSVGATTFPVDEAGIAAYVKLDSVDITDLTEALNYFHSIEKQNETYVIGTVKVQNKYWSDYPHVYIGLDGWIVAYYPNAEEASRIMQWKDYQNGTINTTTLNDAIDIMCDNIGVTYSAPIKYYNFEFPDANKMTVIAETLPLSQSRKSCSNSFSVTIPGILYEGSYSVYKVGWGYNDCLMYLKVDGDTIISSHTHHSELYYGYYNISTQLEVNEPHFITFYRYSCNGDGAATVLIYKSG